MTRRSLDRYALDLDGMEEGREEGEVTSIMIFLFLMNSKNPFLFSYVNKETGGGKEDNKARKKIQSTSFHSFVSNRFKLHFQV